MLKYNDLYRVISKNKKNYRILYDDIVSEAELAGSYFQHAHIPKETPCVGDWVYVQKKQNILLIQDIYNRKTQLSRKSVGRKLEEQVIASNMDYIVIVLGLDRKRNYRERLLERYLTLAWDSGAKPIVVLNKSDLNKDAKKIKSQLSRISLGIDIIISSAVKNKGFSKLYDLLENKIAVFVGPSGVGKSTITNTLLNKNLQKTCEVRPDDKRGRHTTSSTQMFKLSNNGYIIDSPGLKELQLWGNVDAIDNVFEEISSLSRFCKYRNCKHEGEPGCAVQEHLSLGYVDIERYDSYITLKKERDFLERKNRMKKRNSSRESDKVFTKHKKLILDNKHIY